MAESKSPEEESIILKDVELGSPNNNMDRKNTNILLYSNNTRKRHLEFKEEQEKFKSEHHYNSCCFNRGSDRRLLMFIAQLMVSAVMITFCMYMIISTPEGQCLEQYYPSTLSLLIGFWINKYHSRNDNPPK